MRIGLCNGGLLGILSFALIGLYIYLFKGKTLLFSYAVSGCIGVALLLAMLISSAVGTCIPLFFKKINIDPAVASGPLITTVNDLVAVITYYGWLFLLKMLNLAGWISDNKNRSCIFDYKILDLFLYGVIIVGRYPVKYGPVLIFQRINYDKCNVCRLQSGINFVK